MIHACNTIKHKNRLFFIHNYFGFEVICFLDWAHNLQSCSPTRAVTLWRNFNLHYFLFGRPEVTNPPLTHRRDLTAEWHASDAHRHHYTAHRPQKQCYLSFLSSAALQKQPESRIGGDICSSLLQENTEISFWDPVWL